MPAATDVRLLDVTLTVESNGKASASAEWRVDYNADNVGTLSAITLAQAYSTPIPALGAVYSLQGDTFNGLYLKRLTSRRRDEKRSQFVITGEYSTPEPGSTGSDNNVDPIARPAKAWLEFETETTLVAEGYLKTALSSITSRPIDSFGPFINAAGKRWEDAVFEDRQQVYYVQQKNFRTLDEVYALVTTYDHSVNKDVFLGFPKHCVKFSGMTTSPPMEENGIVYYQAILRLGLKREPWYLEAVNSGTMQWDAGEGKAVEITENGAPISEPANLDLDGTRLDEDALATTIQYLTRTEVNYAPLLWT